MDREEDIILHILAPHRITKDFLSCFMIVFLPIKGTILINSDRLLRCIYGGQSHCCYCHKLNRSLGLAGCMFSRQIVKGELMV